MGVREVLNKQTWGEFIFFQPHKSLIPVRGVAREGWGSLSFSIVCLFPVFCESNKLYMCSNCGSLAQIYIFG